MTSTKIPPVFLTQSFFQKKKSGQNSGNFGKFWKLFLEDFSWKVLLKVFLEGFSWMFFLIFFENIVYKKIIVFCKKYVKQFPIKKCVEEIFCGKNSLILS